MELDALLTTLSSTGGWILIGLVTVLGISASFLIYLLFKYPILIIFFGSGVLLMHFF